jgi:hypothetical protein
MGMEDDMVAQDGVDSDSEMEINRDSGDEEEDDEEEEDQEKEDQDADDGKAPGTFGLGEMGNTSADVVDTMVDDQPIVLPMQGTYRR